MTIIERIRQLNGDRNWSDYRLAKEAGLSQSTISNFLSRNTYPSLYTLERICQAYGISMTSFFAGCGESEETKDEIHRVYDLYTALPKNKREEVLQCMNHMLHDTLPK